MDWKKYYFRLEIEQLPDCIWTKFRDSEILRERKLQEKSQLLDLIDEMPEAILDKLRQQVELIWRESDRELMAANPAGFASAILSEPALAKNWLVQEEDEAWKDL